MLASYGRRKRGNSGSGNEHRETYYDAVDWGWERIKRKEEELKRKELELHEKEFALIELRWNSTRKRQL